MEITHTGARLLIILIAAMTCLPVIADESTSNPAPKQTKAVQEEKEEEKDDIWREVTFESTEDLKLTKQQVDQILNELKASNPPKAKELEKLKKTDSEAFLKALREHIQTQKAQPPKDKEDQETWKDKLNRRHERFLEWYKEHYSEEHKELSRLEKSDPEKFAQKVIDLLEIYAPIQRIERYNPELAEAMKKNLELQKRRDEVLLQVQISPESEQEKLIEELKSIVSERFDAIVFEKQLHYEWMQRRLERLKQRIEDQAVELEKLKNYKNQSVDERLNELIGRTEKINWN